MIPKFRAYCDRKISEVIKIDYEGNWVCDEPHVVRKGSCVLLPLSEVKLMQATGLKDKNGVEIFEGDILNNRRYSGIRVLFVKGAFKVRYKKSEICIVIQDLSSFLENYKSTIVIGNIYENPELLEVGK